MTRVQHSDVEVALELFASTVRVRVVCSGFSDVADAPAGAEHARDGHGIFAENDVAGEPADRLERSSPVGTEGVGNEDSFETCGFIGLQPSGDGRGGIVENARVGLDSAGFAAGKLASVRCADCRIFKGLRESADGAVRR